MLGTPTTVDGVDLAQIPQEKLLEAFGPSFVEEFSADPVTVYMSLPDPTKALVRSMTERGAPKDPTPQGDPTQILAPRYSNDL
jgi:hypothetical protein